MNRILKSKTAAIIFALALGGCMQSAHPGGAIFVGARYVAMGSSFAAGPGITAAADPKDRCGRSVDNYAHQLARDRRLQLADVSCGGATTAHILGRWNEFAPQLDALTKDTALVTITIGGNDVEYFGGLAWGACSGAPTAARDARCKEVAEPSDQTWQLLGIALRKIVTETRARAPHARIVLVDYLTVLPPAGTCADVVMPVDRADENRAVAKRLARLTSTVGREAHVDVLRMSRLSESHSACAPEAWTSGFPRPGGPRVIVPFHPNLAGMTAVAQALDRLLGPQPKS